jgi:uncharacterized protein YndB with AHSA1/START domain
MKWLLRIAVGFVALLLVVAAALFILGRRADAGRIHVISEINATPEQVWPWITEGAREKQWVSWLVEVRQDKTKTGVGAREVWVMQDANNGGQREEMEAICTEYAPGSHLSADISSPGMFDGRQSMRVENLGNGRTRLEVDGRFHYSQWFAALMEPLITPAAEKKLVGDVAQLKSLIEKGASNGTTSSAF